MLADIALSLVILGLVFVGYVLLALSLDLLDDAYRHRQESRRPTERADRYYGD